MANPAEVRSRIMRAVKTKDTRAELAVRRIVHGLGYRYRLHRRSLPGSPDLVFPSRRAVIFVHGCFWHQHTCPRGRAPKTRREYWLPKLRQNRRRDSENQDNLRAMGWRALVVWECEIPFQSALEERLHAFLDSECDAESHRSRPRLDTETA